MHDAGGDAGWRSVRWEVYDKYSESFRSLSYDRKEDRWYDEASQWLDGEYPVGGKDIFFAISAHSGCGLTACFLTTRRRMCGVSVGE
ncbi:hypothetical protein BV20DRAFT_715692 [Pilatotrama ljubarskyi]|nr:hypothetical protein BV20DRAFT_715692 [Pilatotrama ljubarskyi]